MAATRMFVLAFSFFALFALAPAQLTDDFRVIDGVSCLGVYRTRNASSLNQLLSLCKYECVMDRLCGGFSIPEHLPNPMCHFITHSGIENDCSFSKGCGSFLAIRDTRQMMISLDSKSKASVVDLRCPDMTIISNISKTTIGSSHLHSSKLFEIATSACRGKQACSVRLNSTQMGEIITETCNSSTACNSVQVSVLCAASSTFNEDIYFTSWSSKHWPPARAQAHSRKLEWQQVVRNTPPYPKNCSGRGIIVVAGGAYLEPALVLAMRLRDIGYQGVIQCWHIGSEEIWSSARPLLSKLNVQTRDFLDYVSPELLNPISANVGLRRFQLKPLSIVHTELKEVLLLDADNIPIRDPTYLFDTEEFKSNSAIFWPDYWMTSTSNPIWDIVGVPPTQEWEQESGQLLINKEKSWIPLNLCVSFNTAFYMHLLNGDKDTFRFAWKAVGAQYHMIKSWPSAVGSLRGSTQTGADIICAHTMLQHDPSGRALFVHHNQMKDLVLPVGENFKYVQDKSNKPCRAVPKSALQFENAMIPCFELEGPGLSFFDDKLLIVNRSHLEVFEETYAVALEEVKEILSVDRILYHSQMHRRSSPSNSTNSSLFQVGSCDANVTNCTYELTVNCSANQIELQEPTNTTDRYCTTETLDYHHKTIYISLATKVESVSPFYKNGSYQDYIVTFHWQYENYTDTHAPVLQLTASINYKFVVASTISSSYSVAITSTDGGGPGLALVSKGIFDSYNPVLGNSTMYYQPTTDLVGSTLFYEAKDRHFVGNSLIIVLATWRRIAVVDNTRFNTAFNPSAQLFMMPASNEPIIPADGDIDALATSCKAKCLTDSDVALSTACLGVYVFRTTEAIICYGLSDLGIQTPSILHGQSWEKYPTAPS